MAAPQGVNFDGTNDYLTRGAALIGAADSKKISGSTWFRSTENFVFLWPDNTLRIFMRVNGSNFQIIGYNSSGTTILNVRSNFTDCDDGNWHHVCFSFDLSDTARRHLYVDDTSQLSVFTYTNDTIDLTDTDWAVGGTPSGGSLVVGDIADHWLDFDTYIDLSIEANRRKFIEAAAANSVDLGSDGSTPTGTSPIIFFSGATASWHTNKGTGGGFTENGALTDAATNPPDYGGVASSPKPRLMPMMGVG